MRTDGLMRRARGLNDTKSIDVRGFAPEMAKISGAVRCLQTVAWTRSFNKKIKQEIERVMMNVDQLAPDDVCIWLRLRLWRFSRAIPHSAKYMRNLSSAAPGIIFQ
jgi:hypothetical protein